MSRSIWKPPFVSNKIIKKCYFKSNIKTWNRNTCIIPRFIGKIFEVHNGITFIKVKVTPLMVGHKLGEFSFTRKPCNHSD
ncbi:30S ribosomal protein S19 [Candidatus Hodgkinia cicadicola]|uniref:Small ribosomal subunit protein uS19 n=1 Tax=Candidatus Hodgkinia cicadicola TaxID=573658 RepID=A0ABX4MGE4_9HYPH|nr:30S ribosomal protein S19 [Candidatus Hodgkinia cicadicola]